MRRTHWWGAAAAAGVLVCAVATAPAALAARPGSHHRHATVRAAKVVTKAKPAAKPAVKHGKPPVKPGKPGKPPVKPGHGHGHGHGHCPYPANGTPSVALGAPDHGHVGSVITVTAKVTLNKCGNPSASAALWASKDGTNWKQISSATTNKDGTASFGYLLRTATMVRVVVAASNGMGASQSAVKKVEARPAKKK